MTRTPEEEDALTVMARREIAWTVVRSRVRNWAIGGAALIAAVLFLWDQIRTMLMWAFR